MRAGVLQERVDIYRQVESTNEYGELSTSYEMVNTYRAKVEHKLGDRTIENQEIVYDYSKTFTLRYYADVRDKDRIQYNDKYYQVVSIEEDRDNQQKLVLTELVNE